MTGECASRPPSWADLYHLAMSGTDPTYLPTLLDNAIAEILDQMEETQTPEGLEEMNHALNRLRQRREYVPGGRRPGSVNSEPSRAA